MATGKTGAEKYGVMTGDVTALCGIKDGAGTGGAKCGVTEAEYRGKPTLPIGILLTAKPVFSSWTWAGILGCIPPV